MELLRSYLSNLPNGDANLLPGISDIFLINNHARDAYFFKQGEQTAFSSGLELITQGSYKLEKEEGDDKKMTLTLTFSEDMATPVSDHKFIIWGNSYLFHRLDKSRHPGTAGEDREHQGCLRVQKDHSRQERYYRRTDEADGFRAQGREG